MVQQTDNCLSMVKETKNKYFLVFIFLKKQDYVYFDHICNYFYLCTELFIWIRLHYMLILCNLLLSDDDATKIIKI